MPSLSMQGADPLRRHRYTISASHGKRLTVDGHQLLDFASNDYLGLAQHPALIASTQAALETWGVGGVASQLICGHTSPHQAAEIALAEFVGMPTTLLFSSGYQANLGVLTTLLGREDAIFADKLNHASLVDGARLSRAKLHRYRHLDWEHLGNLLATSPAQLKLITTDTVFSMDGDEADLDQLLTLAERYQAWLYLDDAHGFGLLGHHGSGSLTERLRLYKRVIYMATLGKAAGVAGAFVAGTRQTIDNLLQRARTYIYTTALSPALAAAIPTSLELMRQGDHLRLKLNKHINRLQQSGTFGNLLPSRTAIQPLLLGENPIALQWQTALWEKGFWVPAIRPPTVPLGTARLRISLSAAHSDDELQQLISALQSLHHTSSPT